VRLQQQQQQQQQMQQVPPTSLKLHGLQQAYCQAPQPQRHFWEFLYYYGFLYYCG
jgi:hypothetical protein